MTPQLKPKYRKESFVALCPPHQTARLATAIALGVLTAGCSMSASPSGLAGSAPVIVRASEYRFDPSAMSVPAGAVTFRVENVGTVEHEFEIFEGEQVVDEIEGLVPGLSRDLTVILEAGDYTYVCKLPGHEEAGMTGHLTVTDA